MWKYLPAIILFLSACNIAHDNKPVKLLGEAQGTYYSIIYFDSQQRDFQYEIDSIADLRDHTQVIKFDGGIIIQDY